MGMDTGLMQLFIKGIMRDPEFLGYKDAFFYRFLAENRIIEVFLYTLKA
jgi:hypothetical protein